MNIMNFAFYAQRLVSASLKAMGRVLLDSSAAQGPDYVPIQSTRVRPASFALETRTSPLCATSVKPLRVLRVMEPGQQRTCVGRMVISGRMADVCAELDRLAAREAAMS